jgi:hypothetical protein
MLSRSVFMKNLRFSGLTWKFHFVTISVIVNLQVVFRVRHIRGMLMVYLCNKFHMPSSVSLLERKRKKCSSVRHVANSLFCKTFYVREDEFLFEDVFPYTISGS